MSQEKPTLDQVYRTFQGAHTTEANTMEVFYNEIAALQKENIELRAKNLEQGNLIAKLQPKKKK